MGPGSVAIVVLLPLGLAMLAWKAAAAEGAAGEGPAGPAARGPAAKLTPCRDPGVNGEVLCGRYEVFEDRAAGAGRKIGLKVVVLPAKGPDVAPDPLVFLAGGGVAPATRYASYLDGAFPELRLHRDILLVDQRGSGESNPLDCALSTDPGEAEYRDEARFREAVRRCRRELERKAALRFYTTPLAMDDLDEVRGWLGYPRLDLFGVSYGTEAAMVYLRRHPEHVRSLVLQGVVPLDVPVWLEFPRSSQEALDRVLAACAGQPACHAAFPNLAQELDILFKRLAETPVKVEATESESGRKVEVPIDREVLSGFLVSTLFSAERIHDLPLLIHLAYQGDFQPLALRLASRGENGIPKGVYLSIVCSEQVPRFDPAALPAAAAGTFMGELRLGRELLACGEWVRGSLPEGFWTPVRSSVPALLLTGALDHVTPPRYGERVARSLAGSRFLVLPGRGHNDTDSCVAGIIEAFVRAGGPQSLDASCLGKTGNLSFALRADELAN